MAVAYSRRAVKVSRECRSCVLALTVVESHRKGTGGRRWAGGRDKRKRKRKRKRKEGEGEGALGETRLGKFLAVLSGGGALC